jgi:hypothetical protein
MKTVLIVAFSTIDKDVRVLRHISALNKDHIVWTMGYGEKPEGSKKHIQAPKGLGYLPISPQSLLMVLSRSFDRAYSKTPVLNWAISEIKQIKEEIDLMFCNDVVTLALPHFAEFKGQIIADMHEYAPREMEDDWRFRLLLQRYYTHLCAEYLPSFDLVTSVSPGLVSEYSKQFGVNCQLLMNAREFMNLPVIPVEPNRIKIVHSGLATSHRHLERMIEACDGLENVTLDLYLMPAPRQARTYKKLVALAKKSSNSRVIPPIPMEDLPITLNRYDVGLSFIAPSSFSLEHGLGNKFFDYIQARLSVLVGPSPDMAIMVDEIGNGKATPGFSADDLRDTLVSLSAQEIMEHKQKSNDAARVFNESNEADKLKLMISHLINS